MVKLVPFDTPSGDAYVLSDEGAEAFRAGAEEAASSASLN